MDKTVCELFAGVGGFRIGFNEVELKDDKVIEKDNFTFVWANQWEPSTKVQHAYDCYKKRFPDDSVSNVDISLVDKKEIPDHTVLCGGFPCQDYSVARSLSHEKGIEGKKGVLWWEIVKILEAKKPPFVFLENVDRLLKSPSKQRGRDFGIMLACLNNLGYAVEWRVVNASDYGFPQRRRRTYIVAYSKSTKFYKKMVKKAARDVIMSDGVFAKALPIESIDKIVEKEFEDTSDLVAISNSFAFKFENSGYMVLGKIFTATSTPKFVAPITLKEIILPKVDEKYYLSEKELEKFKFLRGSKRIPRTRPDGEIYYYSEGSMSPYDSLDLPSRTMLTSEGTTNRSTHIIKDQTGRIRKLTAVECERLNQFPDDWTNTGMPENRRRFMMGNALVTGVIKAVSKQLGQIIDKE